MVSPGRGFGVLSLPGSRHFLSAAFGRIPASMYGWIFFIVTLDFTQLPRGAIGEDGVLAGGKMVRGSARNSGRLGFAFLAQRTIMAKEAQEEDEVGKTPYPAVFIG